MKLNRATLRIVEIPKPVSEKPDGITLDEVRTRLGMPKIGAYDIVTTLVQTGMIHVAREQKQRYTIDLTSYRIGINYTNNLDLISTIDPMLKAFPKEVGETALLGIRSDDSVVCIYKLEPENPIITTTTVGTESPIYCTLLGKAIMVYAEDEGRDSILSHVNFKKHTDKTICIREEFERGLESVREKGYAFDAGELGEHIECVGAPVLGQGSDVMGVISVSSLYKPTKGYDTLGRLAGDKGAQLSHLLGYIKHI